MNEVVVFGATGFTGRLVVEALQNLGVENIVLGGRSEAKLRELGEATGGLEYRVADARRPETLGALVRGAHVVIDTAGPFLELGEPVVQAALLAGAHFLDTTGEQAYMLNVQRRFHGAAKEKRLVIVNAQAFEFALGYCVAAMVASASDAIDTIDVFNRVQGFGATRGTQKSALGALAEAALVRRAGLLVPRGLSPKPMRVRMPGSDREELAAPFPGGEALHLARTYPHVKNITTNLVAPRSTARAMTALFSAQPVYRRLHRLGALAPITRRIDSGPEGPDDATRASQDFKVLARGRGASSDSWAMATGADPYGITGVIAAVGAQMLIEGPPNDVGVLSTDRAFGAEPFLRRLEPHGVELSRG